MPEGHTLHHLARKHHRWFAGQRVAVSSPQGRFSEGAGALDQQQLIRVEAHGKHALYTFDTVVGPRILHIHLGLYGRVRVHKNPAPEPRGAVRMRLVGDARTFDLIGPTRCEVLGEDEVGTLKGRLGQDPIRDDHDVEKVWAKFQRTKRALGAVLLDQSIIAGIGNVYRAELLFLCGLDPSMTTRDLPREHFDLLWERTVALLRLGAKENRIRIVGTDEARFTVPPHAQGWTVPSRYGPRPDVLFVYKRPTCKICGGPVSTGEMANRKLYWCPSCQAP